MSKEGLFGFNRPLGIGPFVKETSPNWRRMDPDIMSAPRGWKWTVDDELGHHVWQLLQRNREVTCGPEPCILLKCLMGYFKEQSKEDSINNWYLVRVGGESYDGHDNWGLASSVFRFESATDETTDILFSEEIKPFPLQTSLQSQQYTIDGAMFTYDFSQWQGKQPTGFIRIPVPNSQLLNELREDMRDTPFEETVMQSRLYSDQFATRPTPMGDYFHPHFAPRANTTQEDYFELFDTAFQYMKRGVRVNA